MKGKYNGKNALTSYFLINNIKFKIIINKGSEIFGNRKYEIFKPVQKKVQKVIKVKKVEKVKSQIITTATPMPGEYLAHLRLSRHFNGKEIYFENLNITISSIAAVIANNDKFPVICLSILAIEPASDKKFV